MSTSFEEKLAEEATKQLTQEQLEKIASNVGQFIAALDKNPELMEEAVEKLGFDWEPILKRLGTTAATAGGIGLGLHGANFLAEKAHEWTQSLGKAKAYKAMLDSNPKLSKGEVDSKAVMQHFNTLYKFNPDYAKDPLVSGAYVINAIDMERPNLETVNNIVNARKNMAQAKESTKPTIDPKKFEGLIGQLGALSGMGAGNL